MRKPEAPKAVEKLVPVTRHRRKRVVAWLVVTTDGQEKAYRDPYHAERVYLGEVDKYEKENDDAR